MNTCSCEKDMWNMVYSESEPVDLRNVTLRVEPLFDTCLKMLASKTDRVLDFGCGTGDILFQYVQCSKKGRGVGVDVAENGINFAKKTAKLSGYRNVHFFEGDENFLDTFEEERFDGIILSNVLDVMTEDVGCHTLVNLDRVLCDGGYWFIKLNPFYSKEELQAMNYEEMGEHMYGEKGILHLKQESTPYWMKVFGEVGEVERYVEFPYEWQPGMNRIFLVKKRSRKNCA